HGLRSRWGTSTRRARRGSPARARRSPEVVGTVAPGEYCASLLRTFREVAGEPIEVVVPELLVVREPVANRAESLRREPVAPLSAVSLFGDEARSEQHAEMLRNRRSAHIEFRRDRVYRAVAVDQQVEHLSARRMT